MLEAGNCFSQVLDLLALSTLDVTGDVESPTFVLDLLEIDNPCSVFDILKIRRPPQDP
jgi:hypothetical protein